ncbi:MAG: hypothetical protein RQ750_16535, partial [Roseovarius sp.]|nr:hypothetical protein [Roseovarius sp.]
NPLFRTVTHSGLRLGVDVKQPLLPPFLALRVWAGTYVLWAAQLLAKLSMGRSSRAARDWALSRAARRVHAPELVWPDETLRDTGYVEETDTQPPDIEDLKRILQSRDPNKPLRAAE